MIRVSIVALLAAASQAVGQRPDLVDDRLRQTAQRVAELDVRRQLVTATPATIDSLLAFYSDSVVYEHPNVGAVVRGKAAMRAGMQQFIGTRPAGAMDPLQITIGPGVAILETTAHADPRNPAQPIPPTRKALRVLEFDAHGLVRRIIDYPW